MLEYAHAQYVSVLVNTESKRCCFNHENVASFVNNRHMWDKKPLFEKTRYTWLNNCKFNVMKSPKIIEINRQMILGNFDNFQ